MNMSQLRLLIAGALACLPTTLGHGEECDQAQYVRTLLEAGGQTGVGLETAADLDHPEAFRVIREDGRTRVEAATPAGWIYGAQTVVRDDARAGRVEQPDFDIRGATLWIAGEVSGGMIAAYHSEFNAERFPWFFDRRFMTRYLDALPAARYNTLFLWASHPFPYILELPEYPGATGLTDAQLRQNQDQFRWLAEQCQRRLRRNPTR